MDKISKDIQNQFQGYRNTPLLWEQTIFGLQQFDNPVQLDCVFNEQIPVNLRLGKRIERFVSTELHQQSNVEVSLENKQIQHEKRTIGEIDCILKRDNEPIHLEIIYKFYLYDERVGNSELEHWIGPNRNDTLLKKLTKLKEKQLPLLYSEHTKPILDDLELNAETIKQRVFFKAQLFVPYNDEKPEFNLLNKECLNGFYIPLSEMNQFENCKFYIPSKVNWLLEVQIQVNWLNYNLFSEKISAIVKENTSPLCWIKFPNGTVQKFFVIWWD